MSNWRDLLRLQQEELGLIPKSSNNIQGASGVEEKKASIEYAKRKTQSKSVSIADETEKKAIGSRQLSKSLRSNVITTINSVKIPLVSDEIDASLDLIETQPDATQRYQTARMKLLSQQIREGDETRRYLAEEATDLRRQLKAEREDSMGLKKRVQLLEQDNKRLLAVQSSSSDAGVVTETQSLLENLTQDIAHLQGQLSTTEQLLKQTEETGRTKDAKLKQSAEVISKLKAQAAEWELRARGLPNTDEERSRIQILEARINTLEQHKSILVAGFQKQLKLIDLLQKQRIHMEAAQLLRFSEEEFVRTLDWTL